MKYIRYIFISLALCLGFSVADAQKASTPKYASKVSKAIVKLTTYTKGGEVLREGNAFYVGESGECIADFALMKDAWRATVTDQSGKTADVDCIVGADDTYSMVRFLVKTKGNAVLPVSTTAVPVNSSIYVLPFGKKLDKVCASAAVTETAPVMEKYSYYTLSAELPAELVGAPVFNEVGELVGILQSAVKGKSYVMDMRYRDELQLKAFMPTASTRALKAINISKGLPDSKEEALVYTYFKSQSADNDEYEELINRFVAAYPDNAEGYYRRATLYADLGKYDESEADLQKYISLSENKEASEVYAQTLRAQMLTVKKDIDGALAIYDKLIADGHGTPGMYYTISALRGVRGDSLDSVMEPLDSAIAMFGVPQPKEAARYILRRGQLLANAGRYREAVVDYNQYCYLMNNKVNASFYYDRSQIEINARMFQQAYDDIISAVGEEPGNVLYAVEKAAICLRVNHIDECVEACQNVLSLDPNQPDAYRIMGYAVLQQEKKDKALEYLKRAVELGDENAQTIIDTYLSDQK